MLNTLRDFAKTVKKEAVVYKNVLKDTRTPLFAKMLLAVALGYALLPFDIVPDFIPVIGYLDDVIIVAILVTIAIKMTPSQVVEYHRKAVHSAS